MAKWIQLNCSNGPVSAHVWCKTVTSYIIKNKTKKNKDPTWDNRTWEKIMIQCTCIDHFTLHIKPQFPLGRHCQQGRVQGVCTPPPPSWDEAFFFIFAVKIVYLTGQWHHSLEMQPLLRKILNLPLANVWTHSHCPSYMHTLNFLTLHKRNLQYMSQLLGQVVTVFTFRFVRIQCTVVFIAEVMYMYKCLPAATKR